MNPCVSNDKTCPGAVSLPQNLARAPGICRLLEKFWGDAICYQMAGFRAAPLNAFNDSPSLSRDDASMSIEPLLSPRGPPDQNGIAQSAKNDGRFRPQIRYVEDQFGALAFAQKKRGKSKKQRRRLHNNKFDPIDRKQPHDKRQHGKGNVIRNSRKEALSLRSVHPGSHNSDAFFLVLQKKVATIPGKDFARRITRQRCQHRDLVAGLAESHCEVGKPVLSRSRLGWIVLGEKKNSHSRPDFQWACPLWIFQRRIDIRRLARLAARQARTGQLEAAASAGRPRMPPRSSRRGSRRVRFCPLGLSPPIPFPLGASRKELQTKTLLSARPPNLSK